MEPRHWWLASCFAAGGLVAGFLLANVLSDDDVGASAATVVASPSPERTSVVRSPVTGESQMTLEDVRRVVREELAASHSSGSGARTGLEETEAKKPPGEAAQAAAKNARDVLAAAIGRRQWTQADADALGAQFHLMAGEDQEELLRQFSQAINQGRLVPDTDRIPF